MWHFLPRPLCRFFGAGDGRYRPSRLRGAGAMAMLVGLMVGTTIETVQAAVVSPAYDGAGEMQTGTPMPQNDAVRHHVLPRVTAQSAGVVPFGFGAAGAMAAVGAATAARTTVKPIAVPDARFFLQLQGKVSAPAGIRVIDADLFDVDADKVARWRDAGIYPICYMSAGSYEDWRPDAAKYPKLVLGKDYEGWAGEKWLDIRQIARLAPIITARLDLCEAKGFMGVDPDNIDGYLTDTGFNLTRADALRFVRWLAIEAHKRGLTIGQKNAPDLVRDLAGLLDFAVTESPTTYGHAKYFAPYVAQHKPVFAIEYLTDKKAIAAFCRQMHDLGFQGVNASQALDGKNEYCAP